jgi:diaminohydroxyphosphoribosylaminopyrimidine deaminase/5-amino-6-(5-phosphoribosylamino)uracil reductase
MTDDFDTRMMRLALSLAERGRPSPNPHVGCVIVRDGVVVARGYHHRAGGLHAEADALRKLEGRAEGATIYTTLEPCNHHGRTPPCSEALIRARVSRVVIGCEDRVPGHGQGAQRLRAAGVAVTMGVCRPQAEAMVSDFHKLTLRGLPFVTLKAALTLDGRMAARTGDARWITGTEARKHAHRLRDRHDAILVGVGTVLADNPELTVRHVRGQDPLRVVLDSKLRTPPSAALLQTNSKARALIFHGRSADPEHARALQSAGAELFDVETNEHGLDVNAVLRQLAQRGIMRVLAEGGPRLHGALLDAGLVDAVAVFVAPKLLADPAAAPLAFGAARERIADAYRIETPRIRTFGEDVFIEGPLVAGVAKQA